MDSLASRNLYYVLLPLTLVMILSGFLRHYLSSISLLNPTPKQQSAKVVREQRALSRGVVLRANANQIPLSTFNSLRLHLMNAYASGEYLKEPPPAEESEPPPPPNPFEEGAMDGLVAMMSKQAIGIIPNTMLMYGVQYFFNGLTVTRLPFPLPLRLKPLLSRGIVTAEADVTSLSAVSWYFLCLFGLGAVNRLLLGDDNAAGGVVNPSAAMMAGGGPAMPGAPAPDFMKIWGSERENLELVEHAWVCDGVEERLLTRFGKL